MKSLFLEKYDATIAYHDFLGGKSVIIYLAGLNIPSHLNFFETTTHAKLDEHRSILVDYLGTGQSEQPSDFSHSMQDHASTVASILDQENLKDCIVVGHSMGGTVGIYLAMSRPDLVSHLLVCEGNLTPGGGEVTKDFTSFSEDEFAENYFPKTVAQWQQDAESGDEQAQLRLSAWGNVDFRGLHRSSASLVSLDSDFKQGFFELPMKRTFIYGEASLPENTGHVAPDAPDPRELQDNDVNYAVVKGVGHYLMLADLDGFVDVLYDLL